MNNQPRKSDKEARIFQVSKWLIDGVRFPDMVKRSAKWNISERTLQRYITEAKEGWVKDQSDEIEIKRAKMVKKLEKLEKSLQKRFHGHPAGIMAISRVQNQIIKLEGLAVPQKVQHSGIDGEPIQINNTVKHSIDYSQLSDETLDEIISARVRKVE